MPKIESTVKKISRNTDTTGREIVITRVFDTPRERVFEAWADPAQKAKWWGPNGFTITTKEHDFKPGGKWLLTMHGPNGVEYPNKTIFEEIVRPERIVYTNSGGRKGAPGVHFRATVTFEDLGSKTELTLRMVFDTAEERDTVVKTYGAIEGGQQTMARLAAHLATGPVVIKRTYGAPIDAVWRAITDVNQMKQWYMKDLKSFEPKVGFQTRFNVHYNGKDFPHIWKITAVTPGKKIAYSWKFEGNPGESFVTFELSSKDKLTKLKLTHEGLETFAPEKNPEMARHNFVEGWTQLTGWCLASFLAKDHGFNIYRAFNAPRERVWKAWTQAEDFKRWFGPKGSEMLDVRMDLRPSGVCLYGMRFSGHEMWGKFVYCEIVPMERIVLINSLSDANGGITRHPMSPTWPLEMLSITTLAERDGKTTLTIRWSPFNPTPEEQKTFDAGFDSMKMGWTGTIDQLENYLLKA